MRIHSKQALLLVFIYLFSVSGLEIASISSVETCSIDQQAIITTLTKDQLQECDDIQGISIQAYEEKVSVPSYKLFDISNDQDIINLTKIFCSSLKCKEAMEKLDSKVPNCHFQFRTGYRLNFKKLTHIVASDECDADNVINQANEDTKDNNSTDSSFAASVHIFSFQPALLVLTIISIFVSIHF